MTAEGISGFSVCGRFDAVNRNLRGDVLLRCQERSWAL